MATIMVVQEHGRFANTLALSLELLKHEVLSVSPHDAILILRLGEINLDVVYLYATGQDASCCWGVLEEFSKSDRTRGHDPLIFWLSDYCSSELERKIERLGGHFICAS